MSQKLLKSSYFFIQSICGAFFFSLAWTFIFSSAAVALRLRPISANGSSPPPSPSASYAGDFKKDRQDYECCFITKHRTVNDHTHLCAVALAAEVGVRGPDGLCCRAAVDMRAGGAVAYGRTVIVFKSNRHRWIKCCIWQHVLRDQYRTQS